MKISILIQESSNTISGPTINQFRLAYQHIINGHQIQLLSLYTDGAPFHAKFKTDGYASSKNSIYLDTKELILWIIQEVNSFKPDFFICDWIVPGILASRWVRLAGVPCVCSHLSDDPFFWRIMHHFAGPEAKEWQIKGISFVSKDLKNKFLRRYQNNLIQTHYIPACTIIPPVKTKRFETLKIVYSGRIEVKQKQIVKLTNSLCDAIESISNSSATLIGSGPDENLVVETIKQRNCSESVYFHGPVAHKNIFKFLKNFNIIILLSDYEGVPASIIEGMACGLVPVCLKCPGGIEELVIHNETGLLVENRGEDFINKLKSLQENPSLLKRLSLAAIEHVKKNYDVGVVAKKWEDFYNSFDNRSSFKRIRTPFWISLPKIKDEGFILSNYTELQFFIYQIRKRFKVGKRIRQFFQN